MQERELILRILRLNMVPAPRVITPGPATKFPAALVLAGGTEVLVNSLKEARAVAPDACAGEAAATRGRATPSAVPNDAPFFVERLPVSETLRFRVSGYSVSASGHAASPSGSDSGTLAQLAVRAAYCLGFRSALVDVGLGAGGPWVLSVTPGARDGGVYSGTFTGARAEYLRVDPVTGQPEHAFYALDLEPSGGRPAFPDSRDDVGPAWISSPMPFPDMPLTTRLRFSGDPDPNLAGLLDNTVAILGMLVSPVEEARQRHATEDGLLGAVRRAGVESGRAATGRECPGFEYLCVPSLLWNPEGMQGIVAAAAAVAANAAIICGLSRPWKVSLAERHLTQRAYYHGDKGFFGPVMEDLSRALARLPLRPDEAGRIRRLLDVAADAARGQPVDENLSRRDFRLAWGLPVPEARARYVSLSRTRAPDEGSTPLRITVGLREVTVPAGNVIPRDPLNEGPLPPWATVPGVSAVRLNPAMSSETSLPADMVYRAVWRGRRPDDAAEPEDRAQPEGSARPGASARATRVLALGPVLGIMAPLVEGQRRFGIETDRFREIVRIAAAQGILAYVFFPEDAPSGEDPGSSGQAPSGGAVQGWLYREWKGWLKERVPVPDVVYDRHIPDVLPTGGIRDVAREFQDRHPRARFINSLEIVRACRDKLTAHSLLSRDPFIARYLAETVLAVDPSAVARFASARKRTYLKLRGGTGSRGLVLIEHGGTPGLENGPFRVSGREKDGQVTVFDAADAAGLADALSAVLHPAEGPAWEYIAQHGIDLAKAPGGEVFEVRVICQKGGAGTWLRTGMVCRFNPAAGRFMIPREELHVRTDELLGQVFPGRVAEIKEEVREIARRVPPAIEEASGRGGEMSVDLGIDARGKPWLIEVNSKPATLFRDIAAFELRELSLRRVVNYAAQLFQAF